MIEIPSLQPLHILGLETDEAVAEFMSTVIGEMGHRYEHYECPVLFLERVRRDPRSIDAAITRYRIPLLGGRCDQVVMGVRAYNREAAYILCAATYFDPQKKARYGTLGVDEFLPKPFDLEDFEAMINKIPGIKRDRQRMLRNQGFPSRGLFSPEFSLR